MWRLHSFMIKTHKNALLDLKSISFISPICIIFQNDLSLQPALSNCRINKSRWFMCFEESRSTPGSDGFAWDLRNRTEHIAFPPGRIERWWTTRWKKNKLHGRGGKWGRRSALPAQMLHLLSWDWSEKDWWEEGKRLENKVTETKLSKRWKAEWTAGILWPVEEWWWQAASLLSFKCQRLNLSSFVLRSFKMLSHGLWSLRLHCFNWIRW